MMERIYIEHTPATHAVHAALFRNVANAAFLQSQLVARNPAFELAFVDAACVVSRSHLLAAVFRAVLAQAQSQEVPGSSSGGAGPGQGLRTPNVHSEIVFSLSPSANIAEAYRRYGITAEIKDVIVVKVLFPTEAQPEPQSADEVWAHLLHHVEGEPVPLTDDNIAACTRIDKVMKYYKLNGAPALLQTGGGGGGGDAKNAADRRRRKEMEVLVLGAMALRGL